MCHKNAFDPILKTFSKYYTIKIISNYNNYDNNNNNTKITNNNNNNYNNNTKL